MDVQFCRILYVFEIVRYKNNIKVSLYAQTLKKYDPLPPTKYRQGSRMCFKTGGPRCLRFYQMAAPLSMV
jgi:hypothetical protein